MLFTAAIVDDTNVRDSLINLVWNHTNTSSDAFFPPRYGLDLYSSISSSPSGYVTPVVECFGLNDCPLQSGGGRRVFYSSVNVSILIHNEVAPLELYQDPTQNHCCTITSSGSCT